MTKKRCSRCGEWRDLSEFYAFRRAKDGRTPDCKRCRNSSIRLWKENHRDYYRNYNREYYVTHRDEIRARHKAYRDALRRQRLGTPPDLGAGIDDRLADQVSPPAN